MKLKLKRVENKIGESMPDIIGQNMHGGVFWIESKALHDWPKRASTTPLKNAFEKGQLAFGRSWIDWGGHSFVFLRVGSGPRVEWLLLSPKSPLIELTREGLAEQALAIGKSAVIEYLDGIR